jgi:hypothetical protein
MENIKMKNSKNRWFVINTLSIIEYFSDIPLFFLKKDDVVKQVKLDFDDIRKAEKTNKEEQAPYRTLELLHMEKIYEADTKDLQNLFEVKFNEAKINKGFKTKERFALHEAKEIYLHRYTLIDWLPILEQWLDFLKTFHKNENLKPPIATNRETSTGHGVTGHGLALYLFFLEQVNNFVKPADKNYPAWTATAREYNVHITGQTLAAYYKRFARDIEERKKHYQEAAIAFKVFPDEQALKNFNKETKFKQRE